MDIILKLKEELKVEKWQVEAAVGLIDEGNTIPFIARYRKEVTGSLNDEVLRNLHERLVYLRNLEEKKEQVLKSIEEQGKLTDELKEKIVAAETMVVVEDLYRPYRPKRKTRASVAKEKGLDGLADFILAQETTEPIENEAEKYIREDEDAAKTVKTAAEALQGAKDIIAEMISDEADYRIYIRGITVEEGKLVSTAKDEKAESVYEMYYQYEEPIKKVAGHRTLAINRGENEKFLAVKVEAPVERILQYLRTKVITKDNPVTTPVLEDVIKDSQGFLWTATKGGGVCRYDSYNFIIFNREDSIHPIRNNFAKALCEDGFKRLWIAGESGLECIDILTLQPLDIPCNLTQWSILQHEEYSDLHHDRNGRLWLSSTRGLFCLTFDTKGRITKIHKGTEIKTDGHEAALHEDGDKLWIGVSNRIYTINTAPPHTVAPYPEIHLPQNADIKIVYRKENDLWIGTTHGLFRHNLTQNTLKAYHATSTAHSLTQDYITDIAETTEHRLLISTLRGINVYREQTDDFEQVYSENQPTDTPDFRFCDFINCILVDRQIIWIGTEADGLMQFSPKRLFIKNYIHKPECPESLSPHAVNAICEDEDGFVYIGTIEGGLNRFHPKEERFTHFTTKDGLSHNAVSCFARSGQSLWVGTWGGGVCLIEHPQSDNPVIRHLLFDGNPDATTGYVCALHFDSLHQQLWIVTDRDIYIYQPDSQKLTIPFKHNKPGGMQNGNAGSYTDIYGN